MIKHPKFPHAEMLAALSSMHMFARLPERTLEELAAASAYLEAQKGAFLFHRGDRADGFYYLIEGCVNLLIISPKGDEKVIEIMRAGNTFGEAVMFVEQAFPASAQVTEESRLIFIESATVLRLVRSEPEFAMSLLAGLSRRLHGLVRDVESYCQHNSVQRVIGYLLRELDAMGAGEGAIELPSAKYLIASRLNLTPETFSRVLSQLTHAGLISVSGATITIHDPLALGQYGA